MENKTVIITGASSGIGLACAWEFAAKGASVVLAARNFEKITATAGKMKEKGHKALAVRTDVSAESDCKAMVEAACNEYGSIDVLVNNAGLSMRALFGDTDIKVLKQLMDVNFWGSVYCTKHALPYLLETRGSVAGISSIAGYQGLPGRTGYSASKFAMHGFLEALRIEYMDRGLHVLIAAPGFTSSNIRKTALSGDGSAQGESPRAEDRMMSAEDVARKIVVSVLRRKRTLVLTTQGRLTVLLKKFAPWVLDRMVYNHLAKEPDSPIKK